MNEKSNLQLISESNNNLKQLSVKDILETLLLAQVTRAQTIFLSLTWGGLSLGICSCVLAGLYIANELDYDRFHSKSDQIYRVTMQYSDAGTIVRTAVTGSKAGPELKRIFPSAIFVICTGLKKTVNHPCRATKII